MISVFPQYGFKNGTSPTGVPLREHLLTGNSLCSAAVNESPTVSSWCLLHKLS